MICNFFLLSNSGACCDVFCPSRLHAVNVSILIFVVLFFLVGMDVTLPDGVKTTSKVTVLSGHFDLPARAGALEQLTYTGHDSCSYCTEHGEVIKTGDRGHVMTFPYRNTVTGHAPLRTAEEVKAQSYGALEKNSAVSTVHVILIQTAGNCHWLPITASVSFRF